MSQSNDTETLSSERMQCMEVWGGNGKTERCLTMPGLKTWVSSEPHLQAEGGGDLFYLSSCASGRITRLLLADVSGHGAEVAGVAVELRDLMRNNVNMVKQDRFVEAMNQQFLALSERNNFATALVGTFFSPRRTLTICNAGHPCPLLYEHAQQRWRMIERKEAPTQTVTDIPLGIVEHSAYSDHVIDLAEGDMVLCYSDALSESCDATGELLGEEGLVHLVNQLDAHQPHSLIGQLFEAILGEGADNLHHDDVTAVLLQVENTRSRVRDNLAAPFRLFQRASINDQL